MVNTFKGLRCLKIIQYNNPNIIGDYTRFRMPEFDTQKLKTLRIKYSLDKIMEPGKTDWEKMILLKNWVKSRWTHGWSEIPEGGNALDIIEAAEKGKTFACGVYSSVFQQCCSVMGIPTRVVSILRDGSDIPDPVDAINTGHCIAEVWSNDLNKWAVIDTDMNCYYEKDGLPLNAYEIRKLWLDGKENLVSQVPEITVKDLLPRDIEEYLPRHYEAAKKLMGKEYADKYMSKASDVYTNWSRFSEHKNMHFYRYIIVPAGGKSYMFADEKEGPLLLVNEYPIQRAWPKIVWTSDISDVYFTLNQTFISLNVVDNVYEPVCILVKLSNTTPSFDHYLTNIDMSDWKINSNEFLWHINEGDNTIRACTVNKLGIRGIESTITVRFRKDV